jgi:hypothetical protein
LADFERVMETCLLFSSIFDYITKKEIVPMETLSPQDRSLAADIRRRTAENNRNNVTRTAAYLDFYQRHPEIHWALLAHLVSRNGGWNMTDLRGEWLPHIMDEREIQAFFLFLERSNWLIFHDAYAQLLLYEEMKRTGSDLTRLLPLLGVSRFMAPLWREFLKHQTSVRLTRGLIVNEQQYIEQRVVRRPFFREHVLKTFEFAAQSVLSLDQVLFPYKADAADNRLSIVGVVVHNFASVKQRIAIGKALYGLLYGDSARFRKIVEWALAVPHTGSRADYWSHLFSPVDPADSYRENIDEREQKPDRPRWYSPALASAWPDMDHPPADGVDWFRDEAWIDELDEGAELPILNTEQYARSLRMVELGMKLITTFI